MYTMLCRNRVEDYEKWRRVFDSHTEAHREAGLHLTDLWTDIEDANNVFFLFSVASLEKARAFIADPASAEAGKDAGVLDGEFHFLQRVDIG